MNNLFNSSQIINILLIVNFLLFGWLSTTGFKSQFVRLFDIYLYGPLLIWFGLNRTKNITEKIFLFFLGATTISYNLKNYLHITLNEESN